MRDLRIAGGVAALIAAATFIFGFVLLAAVLIPAGYDIDAGDPAEAVAFVADHQRLLDLWYVVIYVLFGVVLVALAAALHERQAQDSPLSRVAAVFGFIWSGLVIASGMILILGNEAVVDRFGEDPGQAESLWLAVNTVAEGLGGGVELVGGVWILLVSWITLQAAADSKARAYLGVIVGVAGVLTLVPTLGDVLGALFGLGSIVWFIWVGVDLLRSTAPTAGRIEGAAHAGRS